MISIKVNNVRHYLTEKVAQDFVDNVNVDTMLKAKQSIEVECFNDPALANPTSVAIHFNLLRRIKAKLIEDLEFEKEIAKDQLAQEKQEHKDTVERNKQQDRSLFEDRAEYLRRSLSEEEALHVEKIQKQLDIDMLLEKSKEDCKNRIKQSFKHTIRMFECSNGIIMDGSLTDAENLAKGIKYSIKKEQTHITINDFYNEDFITNVKDAEKMVNEIEDHFYKCREAKQNIYNTIENVENAIELNNIYFKL